MPTGVPSGKLSLPPTVWPIPPEKRYRSPRERKWPTAIPPGRASYLLPLVLAVVGVALILGGIFGVSLPASNAAPPQAGIPATQEGALQVSLPASSVICPELGAWSSDAERVAVLGVPRPCDTPAGTSGTLALVNAATGAVEKTYTLAPMIVPTAVPAGVQANKTLMANLEITYPHLLWSPDGHTLALAFQTSTSTTDKAGKVTTTAYGAGLLVLDTAKGTSRIIPALVADGPRAVPFQALQLVRWDLANLTAGFIWLPQAAGYTWQNDTLTPVTPLAATTSATGAEVAAAGASMGVWSSSSVTLAVPCAGGNGGAGSASGTAASQSPYYVYQSSLTAWSPDGNVLITGDWGQARLAATPSAAEVAAVRAGAGCTTYSTVATLPEMPTLDAGMTQALTTLAHQAHHPDATIAWSPDGRYAVALPMTTPTASGAALTVYDCVTGRAVATIGATALYRVPNGQAQSAAMLPRLSWSPDGRSLLVLDAGYHLVMLLGPRALNA